MLVEFLHTRKMGEQIVHHFTDRIIQFLNHSAQPVDFFNRRIFVHRERQLIIMDSIFFIIAIQADTLCHLVVVHRRRKPCAYQLALIVFA